MGKFKALIVIIASLIISCAPKTTHVPMQVLPIVVDFSKYIDKGFFFTPYEYRGNYESLGIVSLHVFPSANLKDKVVKDPSTGINRYSKVWVVEKIEINKILDYFYKMCIDLHADAVMEFKIVDSINTYENILDNGVPLKITGIELTGYAIKRKGAFK